MEFLTVGHGAWGTTVASVLATAGNSSQLLALRPEIADEINRQHTNQTYLPGLALSAQLHAVTSQNAPRDVDCIVWAIPIQYLRCRSKGLAVSLPRVQTMLNLGKGMENDTASLPSEILAEVFPDVPLLGTLAGPNIADEVLDGKYAEATLALRDPVMAARIAECFVPSQLQIRIATDVRGLEIVGALKNVAAIAGGTADGLQFGANGKALLVARLWEELVCIGEHMGTTHEAFFSITAIADLYATAQSPIGRNRRVGESLAQGMLLGNALEALGSRVAEGVATAFVVLEKAKSRNLCTPVLDALCRLMNGEIQPKAYYKAVTARAGQKPPRLEVAGMAIDASRQRADNLTS